MAPGKCPGDTKKQREFLALLYRSLLFLHHLLRVLWIELFGAVRRAFVVVLRILALTMGRAFLLGVIWLVWHATFLFCYAAAACMPGLRTTLVQSF